METNAIYISIMIVVLYLKILFSNKEEFNFLFKYILISIASIVLIQSIAIILTSNKIEIIWL